MKAKFTLSILLIMFGMIGAFSQATFTDNFSGTLSCWDDKYPGAGNWSIQNNELHGFCSLSLGSKYDHRADLILKDQFQLTGNWKASIDFIRTVDDQFPSSFNAWATFSLWLDNNHKIQISVGGGGDYWGGLQDSIRFSADEWNGIWSNNTPVSTGKAKFNWNPDQWHTASLEKRGNIYSVFVDNACIGHYIDTFLNGQGKIGFHTYGTKRYDNFKLEPIICNQTFADNFSTTLSAWDDKYPGAGNWSIQNNELHGFCSLSLGSKYDHRADLILKDQFQLTGNWKASIDFIRTVDDQFPSSFNAWATFSLWLDNNHKIQISVGGGGDYWGGLQDSIRFSADEWNGIWSNNTPVSIGKVKFSWNPDLWHTASLEKRGNIYSVFIDDACIGHYIDNFLNGMGKVGFHTYGTKRWDNFTLSQCSNLFDAVTINGTVKDINNTPVSGVTLTFTNIIPGTVTTDNIGHYSISVPWGYSGISTPSKTGCTSFTPATRTYSNITANQTNQDFIGCNPCPLPWQVVVNQQYTMNVIGKLFLSNNLTTSASDAIGAFVGQECRGIGYPDPSLNGIIFLTITSNVQTGETVTFKAWKSASCEECQVAETMPFVNQSEVGTLTSPFEFHCGWVPLCVNFGAGYTWFSVNVNPGSMTLNSLFSNLTPCENDRIIGQNSFATYYGTQWVGSLATIDPKAMYKMKLCSQQSWCKNGLPVSITPINVSSGYPWIGYLPQSDLAINTALAGIAPAPTANDRFNGQTSFATNTGTQWVGSLTTLQKGKGYIIHLANPSVLTYPTGMDNPGLTIEDPPAGMDSPTGELPQINSRYTMQIIAKIILPDGKKSMNTRDFVYAYVGSECRGLANPVQNLDGSLFLSIGSHVEYGEEIIFKVFLSDENRLYEVRNKLVFSNELETGTMAIPYEFNLSGLYGISANPGDIGVRIGEIYPNPFDASGSLLMELDQPGLVICKIISGLGQEVQLVMNENLEQGTHVIKLNGESLTAGLYSLLITYSNDRNHVSVLKKMIIR
ncbi:MAG: Ig-like domain-containing protein [Bacteroidota bacterium]